MQELTGHLPIDYPLQPREPIPQIRSRTNHSSNNNLTDDSSILPINALKLRQQYKQQLEASHHHPHPQAIHPHVVNSNNVPFPSRPTSTNSTSSSLSTASSNTKSIQQKQFALNNGHSLNSQYLPSSSSNQSSLSNGYSYNYRVDTTNSQRNQMPIRYDPSLLPNHFKRPLNMHQPVQIFDSDTLGYMRASSTTSSSSSSGSAASSTLSAPTVPNSKSIHGFPMHLHVRSCSESLASDSMSFPSRNLQPSSLQNTIQRQKFPPTTADPLPPVRPPRGVNHIQNGQARTTTNGQICSSTNQVVENRINEFQNKSRMHKSTGVSAVTKPLQDFNLNGVEKFQPYYEETKPFQMSDFYKYSSKHRTQKMNGVDQDRNKTTKQLQEEVLKKNGHKHSSCDDPIQASVKLIEKSGQKLIEATAKAIAGNPELAEKINNILPNPGDKY